MNDAPQRSPSGPAAGERAATVGWRAFGITSIAVAILAFATVLWFAVDVLLLLFGAVLLANVLRAPTDGLVRKASLPQGLALALVVLVAAAVCIGIGWLLVPQVVDQVPALIESLTDVMQQLQRRSGLDRWAESMAEDLDLQQMLPSTAGLIGGATGVISSTFGVLANLVILVVVAVYLAASPGLYLDGVTRLVPAGRRGRLRKTLQAIGQTLRWWMIGQLVSMSAVGIISYVGLTLLGVPLALTLAVVAFLFTFIPFIGPLLSGIPVVLVAFSQGADTAFYALLLYVSIQSFEGYVLSPLVHRQAVALPPALTITAQVLLGVVVGLFGVALATPLAAAGLVAVKMLYVEDVLGEEVESPSPGP